jgi:hypothetical protein
MCDDYFTTGLFIHSFLLRTTRRSSTAEQRRVLALAFAGSVLEQPVAAAALEILAALRELYARIRDAVVTPTSAPAVGTSTHTRTHTHTSELVSVAAPGNNVPLIII